MISIPLIRGSQAQNSPSCVDVKRALVDHGRIRAGVARREVEKYFVQDGGLQFPGTTRYVYTRCRYLHVDIDFEAKASAGQLFSPDDVVTKVSKLYVDYSARD
jgi:hypothetical protein